MKQIRISRSSIVGVILGTVVVSSVALPEGSFFSAFENMYPGSMTGSNAQAASKCVLCHQSQGGGDNYNAYGWDLYQAMDGGASLSQALTMAEPFDADMDPTGASSLDEIDASTQPGWTPGPNNTIYFPNGSTLAGQSPPGGIAGELDPDGGIGTSYCTSTVNTSGQAALISASGSAVVADNDFTLEVVGGPASVPGLFYFGPTQQQIVFGEGFRCVGGPMGTVKRLFPFAFTDGLGNASRTLDLTVSPQLGQIVPGATQNFQYWYRDVMGGPAGFNLSDAYEVTFQ